MPHVFSVLHPKLGASIAPQGVSPVPLIELTATATDVAINAMPIGNRPHGVGMGTRRFATARWCRAARCYISGRMLHQSQSAPVRMALTSVSDEH
jgi:hypothetical protein